MPEEQSESIQVGMPRSSSSDNGCCVGIACCCSCCLVPTLIFVFAIVGLAGRLLGLNPTNSPNGPGAGPGGQTVDKNCCIEKIQQINTNIDEDTARQYCDYIVEEANKNDISAAVVAAVISVESHFDKYAISSSNAVGMMQMKVPAAKEGGLTNVFDPPPTPPSEDKDDRYDPQKNISAGAKYLAKIRDYYYKDSTIATNMDFVIGGYNQGPNGVLEYYNASGDMLPAARPYVESVNKMIEIWKECFSYNNAYDPDCGQSIVDEAYKHIGKPYVWGANGPSTFDCKGLTAYVASKAQSFKLAGLADQQPDIPSYKKANLPEPSVVIGPIGSWYPPYGCNSDQDVGPLQIDLNKLQKGDFVYFKTNGTASNGTSIQGCNGISHTGIYVGDGKIVHARGRAWGVREDNISIYNNGFYGAISICRTASEPTVNCSETKDKIEDLTNWSWDPGLSNYKQKIQEYSQKHYKEDSWQLNPSYIVIHRTAGNTMASSSNKYLRGEDLREDKDESGTIWSYSGDGNPPGISVHYVIGTDGKIAQTLPLNVKSRGTYGANHKAISIEFVGTGTFTDKQIQSGQQLVNCLMNDFGIPKNKVLGHNQVGQMSCKPGSPFCDYRVDGGRETTTYGTACPGLGNANSIREGLGK